MAAKKIRVAINGFGRIGRAAFKIALTKPELDVVAINDITDAKTLAYLLQYDTIYRTYPKTVRASGSSLVIGDKTFPVFSIPDPSKLPWKKLNVDVVLECTGRYTDKGSAKAHLSAGAKRVIVSAPTKGGNIPLYLLGVNSQEYKKEAIVSNASCTTNCIGPVAEVINARFGIEKAMMTTIHSYTQDQRLHDAPHSDFRRARAAAQNIVPTTTGAAASLGEVIPGIKGKFDGLAIRVPTIDVSLSDFTFLLKKKTTVARVNETIVKASKSARYKNVLGTTNKQLVSSDFIGDTRSSIVDLSLTKVVDGNLVKIIAWYDNEWGYSNRLVEMVSLVS